MNLVQSAYCLHLILLSCLLSPRLIEMGGNDIGEDAEEAIMKAQMRRPLLDIVYRIGGNGLRRNG